MSVRLEGETTSRPAIIEMYSKKINILKVMKCISRFLTYHKGNVQDRRHCHSDKETTYRPPKHVRRECSQYSKHNHYRKAEEEGFLSTPSWEFVN